MSDQCHIKVCSKKKFLIRSPLLDKDNRNWFYEVYLTFPHIFSVQVKSAACYIMGQSGQVQSKIK